MINQATLLGNVGKDIEVRTAGDSKVARITLATSESWKDKASGEWKDKTEWHTIVAWGEGLCGYLEERVKKGTRLFVQGKITQRKWQDKEGNDRYSTEIVVQGTNGVIKIIKDAGEKAQASTAKGDNTEAKKSSQKPSTKKAMSEELNDEVPW